MIVSSCSFWLYPPISPYFPSCSSLLIISTPPPHMTFVYSGIGLGSICIGSYSTTGKKKTKMLVTCIDNQLGDSVRLIYRSSTHHLRQLRSKLPCAMRTSSREL